MLQTNIQTILPPYGDMMSNLHTKYTIWIYIKGSVTNLIGEKYILVIKKEWAKKKKVF